MFPNSPFGVVSSGGLTNSTTTPPTFSFGIPASAFTASTTGGFGNTTGAAFGVATRGAFGNTTVGAFGSTQGNPQGIFGNSTSHPIPTGAFTASTTSAFGNTTSAAFGVATIGAFGHTTGGVFGSTQRNPQGIFGNSTIPAGAFTASTTGGFGSTTGGTFGQTTKGVFGNTTGGAFGTTQRNPSVTGGPIFGSKPPGVGFSNTTGSMWSTGAATSNSAPFGLANPYGASPPSATYNTNRGFGATVGPAGTSTFKYTPVMDVEKNTNSTQYVKICCITCMSGYVGKSLEELRLEDYAAGRRGRQHSTCAPGSTANTTSVPFTTGATPPQASTTSNAGGHTTSGVRTFGASPTKDTLGTTNAGTSVVAYAIVTGRDDTPEDLPFGWPLDTHLHCITCMDAYQGKSLEELRLEDYLVGCKGRRAGEMTTSEMTGLLKSIEEVWRCPVCLEQANPPLQMCDNGHIFCKTCCVRLTCCPVCRGKFSKVPARAVEEVMGLLPKNRLP